MKTLTAAQAKALSNEYREQVKNGHANLSRSEQRQVKRGFKKIEQAARRGETYVQLRTPRPLSSEARAVFTAHGFYITNSYIGIGGRGMHDVYWERAE